MTEIIPIRKEEGPAPDSTGLPPDPKDEQFDRALIPPNTATPGRSVKLRNLFSTSGAIASDSTVVTVGTTGTETDLKFFQFFPNEWHVGMCIRIIANGVIIDDGTRTVTLRMRSGLAPTTEWNSMTSTAATVTNAPWNLVWYGIITTLGSSGTLEAQMKGSINRVNKDDPNISTVAFDTTSGIMIDFTADWNGSQAGNSISVRQWLVEVLY